ncbi:NUDIX domain-containing protein [Deinococcus oregonensis]|uniref:NUDIX domain-containing protein n=1 Tax=Deinococcus oregonensis TaxID=1805970 RepID=A0ABV6B6K1_9DEIO
MINSTWYTRVTDVPVRQAADKIVVRWQDNQLWATLTVEREPAFDVIALPKGGVEAGESSFQAAVREVREETGLQRVQLLQPEPFTVEEQYGFGKGSWICCTWFLFVTDERQGRVPQSRHTLMWTPIGSLPEMFWPGERDILREHAGLITRLGRSPTATGEA